MAQKIHSKKIKTLNQNWNFGPSISSCKSVSYLTFYLSKFLKLNVKVKKEKGKIFKPETSILRLSNHKSKKFLNWKPKWPINKSLDKIIEWNESIKTLDPYNVSLEQIKTYIKD